MRKGLSILAAAALVAVLAGAAGATSLWNENAGNLFQDRRSSGIGDIVTVIISENASARESAATETSRQAEASGKVGFGPLDSLLEKVGFETDSSYEGSGSTTHSGSLTARITTQVVRILPNGNLVIEGRKALTVNREEQLIFLTGIVRPDDITSGNTVQSYLIADAQIEYSGKGYIADKQKPGILSRVFNILF